MGVYLFYLAQLFSGFKLHPSINDDQQPTFEVSSPFQVRHRRNVLMFSKLHRSVWPPNAVDSLTREWPKRNFEPAIWIRDDD
uniref:Uncharacterized protein n=1 Tax=Ditylenchus dipsaci TaxID=166011 RepID=A0A915DID4_9BILA